MVVRDVQQFGKFLTIRGALVQHHEKLRVCQHQAGGVGAQQLVHILRQPGHKSVVLADAFPQLVEKVGAVLVAEDGSVYEAPAPKGTLVNAVGAGDSMVAGFTAGWIEKKDYRHAFYMGVSAGSASAFSEYLATKEEIMDLYEKVSK